MISRLGDAAVFYLIMKSIRLYLTFKINKSKCESVLWEPWTADGKENVKDTIYNMLRRHGRPLYAFQFFTYDGKKLCSNHLSKYFDIY